jgi:hypothetical protein
MAVECELSSVFFKWKRIDKMMNQGSSDFHDSFQQESVWEEEYRKLGNVIPRLNGISALLTDTSFDKFLSSKMPEFMVNRHPESRTASAAMFFEQSLFRKRNQILHYGSLDFGRVDAEESVRQTQSLLDIVSSMDRARYDRIFLVAQQARKSVSTKIL